MSTYEKDDSFKTGASVSFSGEVDWREELADEQDVDDEELEETPADVVAMLGFDPAKEGDNNVS